MIFRKIFCKSGPGLLLAASKSPSKNYRYAAVRNSVDRIISASVVNASNRRRRGLAIDRRPNSNRNRGISEVVPFLLLEQRCGMACSATLRRPRRCRCSRTGWRHTYSAAATKLFDFNDISFPSHYLPPQNSGPCNSFYCLDHSENVYDDDDDDEMSAMAVFGGGSVDVRSRFFSHWPAVTTLKWHLCELFAQIPLLQFVADLLWNLGYLFSTGDLGLGISRG